MNDLGNHKRIGISVLISVYAKEHPEYLSASLESVFSQSWRAKEVLLIKDGPLTPELDSVIMSFTDKYPELRVVAFKKNRGLGYCLNDGLDMCSYDIVARMDSDDICKSNRFEREYTFLSTHPDYALVGSWIDEFTNVPGDSVSVREVPETPDEILRYAHHRCPVNHPTVMFRKAAVMDVGGYLTAYFPEDYFLWIRMLMAGYKFYNLQESLLWFRYSINTINRRGGWKYAKDEVVVQHNIYKMGFITFPEFLVNVAIRFTTRIVPARVRVAIYKKIRTRKKNNL
ncbi:MAG: glycosyltransferase [Prevotella sp.]|nr:glycosyltransferase [Prevotella sp.]